MGIGGGVFEVFDSDRGLRLANKKNELAEEHD